eukprot:6054650-Alexandrium_andersonii.AAC.1
MAFNQLSREAPPLLGATSQSKESFTCPCNMTMEGSNKPATARKSCTSKARRANRGSYKPRAVRINPSSRARGALFARDAA